MMINDGIKRYRHRQLVWLGIYAGIGLAIVFLFPFPIDLILVIGTMVAMNFIRRRWLMRKYLGRKDIGGLLGSFPSTMTGKQPRALKYYCMNCGNEHNEIACPNCGSKMKREDKDSLHFVLSLLSLIIGYAVVKALSLLPNRQ